MKSFVSVLLLSAASIVYACFLISGCQGGGAVAPDFSVTIIGPNNVQEGSQTVFKVSVIGDSVSQCNWASTTGETHNLDADPMKVTFIAPTVDRDTEVKLQIALCTIAHGMVNHEKVILVHDGETPPVPVTELTIKEVWVPTTAKARSFCTFYVLAEGDTGITYEWSLEPSSAGSLSDPRKSCTMFNASDVVDATTAKVHVLVASDNCAPIPTTKEISIIPYEKGCFLSAGNIIGEGGIDEGDSALYTVTAQSDRELAFEWTVDPPYAGYFDTPHTMSTNFIAGPENPIIIHHPPSYDYHYRGGYPWAPVEDPFYDHPLTASISVTVTASESGECEEESVEKARNVALYGDPPYVTWLEPPTEIMENQEVPFSIKVLGLPGPSNGIGEHLDWIIDPPYAGTFVTKQEVFNDVDKTWETPYITGTYCTEVTFKAAMVQEDTTARIVVAYVVDNDPKTRMDDDWTILDSISVTIVNITNPEVEVPDLYDPFYGPTPYFPPPGTPPPMNHWTEPTGIVGPTEIVAAFDVNDISNEKELETSWIEHRFYFGIPDADPSWQFNDIQWDCEIIYDGWDDGMPYFGDIPNLDFRYGMFWTLDQDGEITSRVIELVVGGIKIETWLKLTAAVPGGVTHEFVVVARPPSLPCWEVLMFPPRWWSYHDTDGPFPPQDPEKPSLDNLTFTGNGVPPPYILKQGDIVRLFVQIYPFVSIEGIDVEWTVSPPDLGAGHDPNGVETVHFWGDEPFELPQEEKWDGVPCHTDWTCGSHYFLPGGGPGGYITAGVEVTCHSNEAFTIRVKITSEECGTVEKSIMFNSQ